MIDLDHTPALARSAALLSAGSESSVRGVLQSAGRSDRTVLIIEGAEDGNLPLLYEARAAASGSGSAIARASDLEQGFSSGHLPPIPNDSC